MCNVSFLREGKRKMKRIRIRNDVDDDYDDAENGYDERKRGRQGEGRGGGVGP